MRKESMKQAWRLLLLVLLLGYVRAADRHAPGELPACCQELKPDLAYTDRSLYQLESLWTSDLGKTIRLGVFHGRPQVVAMFFAHCEYACPIIVHDMKAIEARLPDDLRDRVGFLLITFDSERDTVEVLHEYRMRHKLPVTNWTLLRAKPDDALELAALLGVKYKRDLRGQFAHSNLITVLNAEGEIAHQQVGLNQDPVQMVGAIQRLFEP